MLEGSQVAIEKVRKYFEQYGMEEKILEKVVQSELDIPHALLEIHRKAEPSIRENVQGKWKAKIIK